MDRLQLRTLSTPKCSLAGLSHPLFSQPARPDRARKRHWQCQECTVVCLAGAKGFAPPATAAPEAHGAQTFEFPCSYHFCHTFLCACNRNAWLLWHWAVILKPKGRLECQLNRPYCCLQKRPLHCCRRPRTCRARLCAPTGTPRHWPTWETLSGRYAAFFNNNRESHKLCG